MESCVPVIVFFLYLASQSSALRQYRYHNHNHYYYGARPKQSTGPSSSGYMAGAAFAVIIGAIVVLYFMFKVGCCKNFIYKTRRNQAVCPAGSSNTRPVRRSSTMQMQTLSVPQEPPPYESQPTYLPSPPAYSYEPPPTDTYPYDPPPEGALPYDSPPEGPLPYDSPPEGSALPYDSPPDGACPYDSPPDGAYPYESPPDYPYPYEQPSDGTISEMTSSQVAYTSLSPPPPYSTTTQS